MGNMIVRIKEYRESGGGYIKFIILNAASSGAMQSVEVTSFGNEVTTFGLKSHLLSMSLVAPVQHLEKVDGLLNVILQDMQLWKREVL